MALSFARALSRPLKSQLLRPSANLVTRPGSVRSYITVQKYGRDDVLTHLDEPRLQPYKDVCRVAVIGTVVHCGHLLLGLPVFAQKWGPFQELTEWRSYEGGAWWEVMSGYEFKREPPQKWLVDMNPQLNDVQRGQDP